MFAIGSCGGSGYSFPSSSEFKVGACKVPYNKNATYVSQGPTLALLHNKKLVNAGTDEQAVLYAWKFIKYLTNEDVNATQCASNSEGYIPVRQSAYNTPAFTNFIKSDTDYVVVTKAVIEEVNGSYFSSPVFKGSAGLRKQCEGCFADVMKLSKGATEEQIKTVLDRCISQAIIGM
jgi:ABC-type glycerol-3-phosphate transport system substrate-binding protein